MTSVVQAGSINATALIVADAIVQIQAPQLAPVTGQPTNIAGAVGTAQWGPINAPIVVGNMAQYAQAFGAVQPRKYDLGTLVAAAVLQGANNFRCVRVTDGTDVAAMIVVQSTCITFTAKYTGTLGNNIQVSVAPGTKASTFKATVTMPGQPGEIYDNIAGSANALWVAMAAAINSGISGVRGASGLIVATAGAGTTAPATATYSLASGTDGVATITSAVMIGADTTTRTGMYALRGTGCSKFALADSDDSTIWTTITAFAISEGMYGIGVTPSGDTIASAISAKATAGIDSYDFKLLLGDWCYWNDPVSGLNRLVSPQGFALGLLANTAPQNSGLNQQVFGVTGTQRSVAGQIYSQAELGLLAQAGIDVICNPIPAGNQFGLRNGRNTSSNAAIHGDNYTTMTNYLAYSIGAVAGKWIGGKNLQSSSPTDPWRRGIKAALDSFLQSLSDAGQIDRFSTQCDLGNNSLQQIALGYGTALVMVRYLAVVEFLLINVVGGQSVTVQRVNTQALQAA